MADEPFFLEEPVQESIEEPAQDVAEDVQEPVDEAPIEEPVEDTPPEDPEERYKFWQSKHDKLQEEKAELEQKAKRAEELGPLLDYASQYEHEFYDFLDSKLQGGQTAGTPSQAGDAMSSNGLSANGHSQDSSGQDPFEVLNEPMPERPKRPEDRFDDEAMAAYEAKRDAYDEAMDRRVRAQQEIVRSQAEQQRQAKEQQKQLTQAMSYVRKLGAAPDEAQAFLRDYLDPSKRAEMDKQMLAAWRAQHTESAPEPKKSTVDPARLEKLREGKAEGPGHAATTPGRAESRSESIFATEDAPAPIW